MVQEVRSILFTADECRDAVTQLLMMRTRGLRPEQVSQVELRAAPMTARVTFRGGAGVAEVLGAEDLMSAVLLYCSKVRIPLSTRSHKRLSVIAGCLALTTSINLRSAEPAVEGGAVVHSIAGPDLAVMHTT